jgi:hypothetical protein
MNYDDDGNPIYPRVDYVAITEFRRQVEVLAERCGFVLSVFKLEEYPGHEWSEPMEITISVKQSGG